MDFQARKIHVLEEVLKIGDNSALSEIESALRTKKKKSKRNLDYNEFSGVLSKKEADEMEKAIKEACEQINPNDWK